MNIEKIVFDANNPFNSSILYSGFKDYLLKREGIDKNSKLIYNDILDKYLKENYDRTLEAKRTVIDDYLKNDKDWKYFPMFLKNQVTVGLHYKASKVKQRIFTRTNIIELSHKNKTPILVNFLYGNYKHDPNPQVLILQYEKSYVKEGKTIVYKYPVVSGFNIHYLNIWELKRLIKLLIKFPEIDPHFFYHNILKVYALKKSTKYKMEYVRRWKTPYKKYPSKHYANIRYFKGMQYDAENTASQQSLDPLIKTNNILMAYRKYYLKDCALYNIPLEIFDLTKE